MLSMKTAMLLLALAFGFTACSASTDELLPTQDDNSIGNSHTYNSLISKQPPILPLMQKRWNIRDALNA